MLLEKVKPAPRAELLQSERRSFPSAYDPVGDRAFGGRLSGDALGHGYTRNSDVACTPALRPHDRARGTSVIAVESDEPRVIQACRRIGT